MCVSKGMFAYIFLSIYLLRKFYCLEENSLIYTGGHKKCFLFIVLARVLRHYAYVHPY